ncbi:unnamed protein product [Caenorhabditis nigoni]
MDYGIKNFDNFFNHLCILKLDCHNTSVRLTLESPPSETLEEKYLEQILMVFCRGFYSFLTRSPQKNWMAEEHLFRHHGPTINSGGSSKVDLCLESAINGTATITGQMFSIKTDTISTLMETVVSVRTIFTMIGTVTHNKLTGNCGLGKQVLVSIYNLDERPIRRTVITSEDTETRQTDADQNKSTPQIAESATEPADSLQISSSITVDRRTKSSEITTTSSLSTGSMNWEDPNNPFLSDYHSEKELQKNQSPVENMVIGRQKELSAESTSSMNLLDSGKNKNVDGKKRANAIEYQWVPKRHDGHPFQNQISSVTMDVESPNIVYTNQNPSLVENWAVGLQEDSSAGSTHTKPPIVSNLLDCATPEKKIQIASRDEEITLVEVPFSPNISSIFPTLSSESLRKSPPKPNKRKLLAQKKRLTMKDRRSQKLLPSPGVDEFEQSQMNLAENSSDFVLLNIKGRHAINDTKETLANLLEKMGVRGKLEDVECIRLPTKGSSYMIQFKVWNPMDAKILNRLVGSTKHWSKRFNMDIMGGKGVFIWKPVSTSQIMDAIVATTIQAFNICYNLPSLICQLNTEKVRRDFVGSTKAKHMMIALKKVMFQSVLKTLEDKNKNGIEEDLITDESFFS